MSRVPVSPYARRRLLVQLIEDEISAVELAMQRDPRWAALRDRLEAALNTVGSLELYSLHMIEAELSEASSDSPQGRQEAPGLAQDEGAAKPLPPGLSPRCAPPWRLGSATFGGLPPMPDDHARRQLVIDAMLRGAQETSYPRWQRIGLLGKALPWTALGRLGQPSLIEERRI